MRYMLCLWLVSALVLPLAGCGSKTAKTAKTGSTKTQTEKTGRTVAPTKTKTPAKTAGKPSSDKGAAAPAAKNGLDLSVVTDEFVVAMVVHPAKLFGAPVFDDPEVKKKIAEGTSEIGVDPNTIVRGLLLMAAPGPGGKEPAMGMVLILNKEIDHDAVMKTLEVTAEKIEADGRSYYKGIKKGKEKANFFYYPNPKTVVRSQDEAIFKKMMAGSGGSSPLCEQLGKVDLSHDIVAVVTMAPLRKPEVLEGAPLPVAMLIKGLDAAQITVDVTGDVPLAISMKAINAESAQAVEGMAKGQLADGKKMVAAMAEDPLMGPMLLMFDAEIKGALGQHHDRQNRHRGDRRLQDR